MNVNVHVRRSKLRRFFETEMARVNGEIRDMCGDSYFFVRFSPHMLDRIIDRQICEHKVMNLFTRFAEHIPEIKEYLSLPDLPDGVDATHGDGFRPLRLEVTDGTLWVGMTVDKTHNEKERGLCCRMIIENSNRLEGKTSTKVIRVH